ncbi:MAG: hypothetical protein Q9219_001436 [cf. Caloplaca sp. 3 TL-2023]
MTSNELAQKIEELSDLELALLLTIIAKEHCLIRTVATDLDALSQELQLITSTRFDRSFALVDCNAETTFKDLANALLITSRTVEADSIQNDNDKGQAKDPILSQSTGDATDPAGASRTERRKSPDRSRPISKELRIANVAMFKSLSLTSYEIQIEVLENDHIFMSHYHDPEDGFMNLEAASEEIEDDTSSSSSVLHKSLVPKPKISTGSTFSETDIQNLIHQSNDMTMTAEVRCYLHNIVTFLRVHRAVDWGITPRATTFFKTLVKCLAPLHGLNYVTPSLVDIAARKIYPHRIIRTVPERERSMQYGSDLEAVRAYLESMTLESIVEDVIASVETPL